MEFIFKKIFELNYGDKIRKLGPFEIIAHEYIILVEKIRENIVVK